MVHVITEETFEHEVAASDVPCVVEFTGAWCALCEKMLPTLEELSEKYEGKIKFCTVDTDVEKKLRIKFAVAAMPYIVLVHNGMKTPLFDEYVSAERLEERINLVLAEGSGPTTRPL